MISKQRLQSGHVSEYACYLIVVITRVVFKYAMYLERKFAKDDMIIDCRSDGKFLPG